MRSDATVNLQDFKIVANKIMLKGDVELKLLYNSSLDDKMCIRDSRIVNVHPSLIPSFCGKGFYGLHVHEAALQRGVKVTGATVHFVNNVCDGGPIILQKAVSVHEDDTPETLQKRVMEEAEWHLLPQAVSLICDEKVQVVDGITHIQE